MPKPRKILIVSQYFWPEHFRINELATLLAGRGHGVTVLTGIPNYPQGTVFTDYAADPARFARYGDVGIVRVPMTVRGRGSLRLALNYASFAVSAAVLGAWRLRGQAFDAVFVFQTSPATVGLPAALLARMKRAPMLFWVLDCWPETLSAVGATRNRAVLGAVGAMVRFIYARSALILGQSKSFIDNVTRYGDAARFRHFPNWVEAGDADPVAGTAPRLPAAPGIFTIMFAGNIGEAQDFPAILDAAAMLRDAPVRWIIVGDGRDADAVRAGIAARGLAAQVRMLGRHPPETMPGLFAQADALLVSLKADPLFAMTVPGKLQSYLAAGKPVLAMLDGEGAATVREAGAGLASAAGDSAALAANVRVMMALRATAAAAMGRDGRAYAAANYDRETLVDRLEGWLGEVLAPDTSGGRR